MFRTTMLFLLAATLVGLAAPSLNYLPLGHVTLIEPTYMPNLVQFQMDTGDGNCPAGSWVQWSGPNAENNKTVYASLLAAMLSNRQVQLVYDPAGVHANQSPCLVQFIHIH